MKLELLFDVHYGSNLELSNVEELDVSNGVPYVSRTSKNCGVSAYIAMQPNNVKINPKHTLSVALGSSSVLETFYQDKEYYSGRDIAYLKPKFDMTKEEMIYYALCIRANKLKYSYGRQANRTLKYIELPDIKNLPNWIKNINHKNFTYYKKESNSLGNLKPVLINDLFFVERGSSPTMGDMERLIGDIPVISATEKNNGISLFTSANGKIFKGNCLTLVNVGSIGECFYQEDDFILTGNVCCLIPKFNFNKYIGLYISTLLRKEGKTKYCYGRTWDTDLVKNTIIQLPFIGNNIDWNSIENYMRNIESKYVIS